MLKFKNNIVMDSKPSKFQVGVTSIEVKFLDGSTFITKIYGIVNQMVHYGADQTAYNPMREAFIGEVMISSSLKQAQAFLTTLGDSYNSQSLYGVTQINNPGYASGGTLDTGVGYAGIYSNGYVYTDDPKNPMKSAKGIVKNAKILYTDTDYEIEFKLAHMEPRGVV